MSRDLASRHCIRIERGTPPLTREVAEQLRQQTPDWVFEEDGKAVRRQFKLKDFKEAIAFVNAAAGVADAEDHHPDIFIRYRQVTFTLSTHAIGGLSENDFILAAKIDNLHGERFASASATPAGA